MAQREAEVLLQIESATLLEIKGKERIIVGKGVEVLIVSIIPTAEEIEQARVSLRLPEGALTRGDGRPLVFILSGDYKIPICATVPAIKESPRDFVFAVPNLWLGISFPPETDEETIEGFEMLVKTYGVLRSKSGSQPSTPAATAALPAEQARSTPVGYGGAVVGQPVEGQYYDNGAVVAQPPAGHPPLAAKVVGGIGLVTGFAVRGLRKGAALASGGVKLGAEKIKSHTTPCEQPVQVPQEVKSGVAAARTVSKSAVLVTGALATALVGVSAALGTGAVGVVGRVLPRSAMSSGPGIGSNPHVQNIKQVAGAAVGGVATVMLEASDAARTILTSTCDGISTVVTHKFGGDVGQTTTDALGIVQDGVAMQQNIDNIGVKAIAKRAAQHAGNQLAEQYTRDGPPAATALPEHSGQPVVGYPVVEEPGETPYRQAPSSTPPQYQYQYQ